MSYTRVGGGSNTVTSIETYRYVVSAGQTSVSGVDSNGRTLSYTPSLEVVFLNGVRLVRGDDYVATTGTSITGLAAMALDDVVEVMVFQDLEVANALTQAYGDGTYATIANPTFTGVAQFPDGSASAPAITNTGDTNTGLFYPAEDTVAISTGGTERLRVNASGNVGIGLIPGVKVHIGNDTAQAAVYVDSATNSGALHLRRANTSLTSPTVVASGDTLGVFDFAGYDGSAYRVAARIRSDVDATPGASDMPGRIGMWTCADGSATLTERLRIDSNGLITGTGTSLGAWTAYTPTLGGTGWAIGDGTATGAYCRIGKLVVFRAKIVFGSTSTYGAGSFDLTLPVTASSGAEAIIGRGRFTDTGTATYGTDLIIQSTTQVTCRINGTNGLWGVPSSSSPFTWASTDIIAINGVYEAA